MDTISTVAYTLGLIIKTHQSPVKRTAKRKKPHKEKDFPFGDTNGNISFTKKASNLIVLH